jgi:GxxExxY protein
MAIQDKETTDLIIKTFYQVYNELGYGFLEKVYHNALLYSLNKNGLLCTSKKKLMVYFQEVQVGEYYPDLIVNELVILELKTSETLSYEHECQLINYLRATDIEIGLLLNFGKKPEFRRKYFTNDRKKIRGYP